MRFGTVATLLAGVAGLVASPLAAEPLTLEEAIRRSLSSSPQGEAAAARIETLKAARAAADTKPAATIDGSVENIGTGGFSLFRSMRPTINASNAAASGWPASNWPMAKLA